MLGEEPALSGREKDLAHGDRRVASERSRTDALQRPPPEPRRGGVARSLLVTARPRQWAKNVLVFGAPAVGGVLLEPDLLIKATLTFIAFCLASSGMYYVNDIVDRQVDREHWRKRLRPLAAGQLGVPLAAAVAVLLVAGGLAVAVWADGWRLAAVLLGYVVLALAYTLWLRGIVLLDVVAVAGLFVLRAAAGGVAVGVPLSSWFLIVACFGALFIAAGKRRAEHNDLGHARGDHRKTLDEYSESYLRYIMSSASTVTIAAYCLWAFEGPSGQTVPSALSILPFVLGIYRYAMLLDAGSGDAPEHIVLRDRPLQLSGLLWVLLVALGVYLQ
jgi:decaprenyl-phosphate phosphoribosyltransferase